MLKEFFFTLWSYLSVLRFIVNRRIIYLFLSLALLSIGWGYLVFHIEYIVIKKGIEALLEYSGVLDITILNYFQRFLSSLFSSILALFLAIFTFRYSFYILFSPWLSLLSLRLERLLIKMHIEQDMDSIVELNFWNSVWRSIKLNTRMLIQEIKLLLLFFAVSLIPGVGVFGVVGIFLVQAWFAGFSNLDFALERTLNFKQSISFAKRSPGILLAIGIPFVLMIGIPVVGWMIAPVWSVMTSTYVYTKKR